MTCSITFFKTRIKEAGCQIFCGLVAAAAEAVGAALAGLVAAEAAQRREDAASDRQLSRHIRGSTELVQHKENFQSKMLNDDQRFHIQINKVK